MIVFSYEELLAFRIQECADHECVGRICVVARRVRSQNDRSRHGCLDSCGGTRVACRLQPPKNLEKSLAMPVGIVTNGVILRSVGG